jgi:fructan beta-fructosidase
VRIHRKPVRELEASRKSKNQADNIAQFTGELIELRAEFVPDATNIIEFELRGAKISYDASKQELQVNDVRVAAPLKDGKQDLIVYVDKTMLEVFACDGLIYAPLPWIPKASDVSIKITNKRGGSKMDSLEIYELETSWPK